MCILWICATISRAKEYCTQFLVNKIHIQCIRKIPDHLSIPKCNILKSLQGNVSRQISLFRINETENIQEMKNNNNTETVKDSLDNRHNIMLTKHHSIFISQLRHFYFKSFETCLSSEGTSRGYVRFVVFEQKQNKT